MHLSLGDKVIFRDIMSGNYSTRIVGDNKRITMCPKPSKYDFMILLLVIGVNFIYFTALPIYLEIDQTLLNSSSYVFNLVSLFLIMFFIFFRNPRKALLFKKDYELGDALRVLKDKMNLQNIELLVD
jgi:hypothetical protein